MITVRKENKCLPSKIGGGGGGGEYSMIYSSRTLLYMNIYIVESQTDQ